MKGELSEENTVNLFFVHHFRPGVGVREPLPKSGNLVHGFGDCSQLSQTWRNTQSTGLPLEPSSHSRKKMPNHIAIYRKFADTFILPGKSNFSELKYSH